MVIDDDEFLALAVDEWRPRRRSARVCAHVCVCVCVCEIDRNKGVTSLINLT